MLYLDYFLTYHLFGWIAFFVGTYLLTMGVNLVFIRKIVYVSRWKIYFLYPVGIFTVIFLLINCFVYKGFQNVYLYSTDVIEEIKGTVYYEIMDNIDGRQKIIFAPDGVIKTCDIEINTFYFDKITELDNSVLSPQNKKYYVVENLRPQFVKCDNKLVFFVTPLNEEFMTHEHGRYSFSIHNLRVVVDEEQKQVLLAKQAEILPKLKILQEQKIRDQINEYRNKKPEEKIDANKIILR